MKINKIEENLKIKINRKFGKEIVKRIKDFIENKIEEVEGKNILEKIYKIEKYIELREGEIVKIKEEFYKEYGIELKNILNPIWYKEREKKKEKIKEIEYELNDVYEYIKKENYEAGNFMQRYGRKSKEENFKKVIEEFGKEKKKIVRMISYFYIERKEEKDEFGGFYEKDEIRRIKEEGKEEIYHYNEKSEEIENEKNEKIKINMTEREIKKLKDNLKEKKELAKKILKIKEEEIKEEEVKKVKLEEMVKDRLNEYKVFSRTYEYKIRKGRMLRFSKLRFLKEYGYDYEIEKKEVENEDFNYFNIKIKKRED